MDQQRRIFLARAGKLATLAASGAVPALARAPGASNPFTLGVASGSPLPTAVILWTRILHDPLNAAATPPIAYSVRWEVSENEAFTRIAAKGIATALPEAAHSLHVDATGLRPDRWYWYRFMLGDAVSPIGRTRTAPAPDAMPARLRIAAASCQHWEFASFAAHAHIAAATPDLVAFLGDYIYEWGPYQLHHPEDAKRVDESFTLADYRARYAQYKTDPQLQAAHHAAPWIVTWDDHEVANDYGSDRDELLDPNFLQRRAAAYQAFYEHMPLRLAPGSTRIYQRYDWGRLARIHVLDDRQYRSHHACTPPDRGGSSSLYLKACAELADPSRTMLGAEQEAWLADGLSASRARWNVIAQQTLMAQSTQVPIVHPGDGRIWNDGWDGYPMARRRLLESLQRTRAANPVVLGGDVHTFYATALRPDFGKPVSAANPVMASEFVIGSVTSPSRPQARTLQMVEMNPHIKYGRSDKRGYTLLDITPAAIHTQFMALDDAADARSGIRNVAGFRIDDGRPGIFNKDQS